LHVVNIIELFLGLIFIILVQIRLHGTPLSYTTICVPLYPFFFTSYFFYVLQILLISLKLDKITLLTSSWPVVLSIIYCISGWHLLMLSWWGWKNARQNRELLQYFRSHHRAIIHTKLALWAITIFRPWFLTTLSISLLTAYLVGLEQGSPISFIYVAIPLMLGIGQNLFITGVILPLYLYYLRYRNRHLPKSHLPPTPIKFSVSDSFDESHLSLLYKFR